MKKGRFDVDLIGFLPPTTDEPSTGLSEAN